MGERRKTNSYGFSDRHGLKSYATSGRSESDVYSFFLNKGQLGQIQPKQGRLRFIERIGEKRQERKTTRQIRKRKKAKKRRKKQTALEVKFDWDGLKDRKKRLTIHSSRLADAVLSKDGENLILPGSLREGSWIYGAPN
jgi:tricorn protease